MLFKRNRHMTLRRLLLLLGDIGVVALSIVLAAFIRLAPHSMPWMEYLQRHLFAFTLAAGVFLLVMYVAGMYEAVTLTRKRSGWLLSLVSTAGALVLLIVVFFAWPDFQIGRGVLLLAALFVFFGTFLLRLVYRVAIGLGLLCRSTLVAGDPEAAARVIRLIQKTDDSGFRVFGVVTQSVAQPGSFVEGVPILGSLHQLREFVHAYDIETVVVATALAREPVLLKQLRPLRYSGVELMDYTWLYEELAQEIPLDHIDDEWLMHAAMNGSVIHIRKMKRILDLVVATVGLVLSSPLALLAAIAIRLDSPGPVLYRQRRSGLDGEPYTLLKFRTMRADAEVTSGAVWAGRYDARVTRVGRFLRKWRVDEIPQLVNVLKGEMSLVGPRPERPEFVDTLAESIPFYRERLLVPPGVTGWAQVKFPYAASMDASRRKLQFDLYYIKHMRFLLDIQILLRTFRTILVGLRHSEAETTSVAKQDGFELKVLESPREPTGSAAQSSPTARTGAGP